MKYIGLLSVSLFALFMFPLSVLAGGGKEASEKNQPTSFIDTEIRSSPQDMLHQPAVQNPIIQTPSLGEITAFHVALIAFFIPLSVDMVGRISERYGSSTISNYYKREKIPWIIFYLSVVNTFLSVFLIYTSSSARFLSHISVGIFTITLGLVVRYLHILYRYLTDIDWVIGRVIKDVKKIID